jgi:hypothetical protein
MQRPCGPLPLDLSHHKANTAFDSPLRNHLDIHILSGNRIATSPYQPSVIPEGQFRVSIPLLGQENMN